MLNVESTCCCFCTDARDGASLVHNKKHGGTQPVRSCSPLIMPSRPHYEVYQTQMLKKLHGFPQFNADPEGNQSLRVTGGVGRIEIGDVGYFQSVADPSFDAAER
jgi:hypothetical protein